MNYLSYKSEWLSKMENYLPMILNTENIMTIIISKINYCMLKNIVQFTFS